MTKDRNPEDSATAEDLSSPSLRRAGALALESLQLRLALLAVEFESAWLRQLSGLANLALAAMLGLLAVVLLITALLLALPEDWRWMGAAGLGLLMSGGAAVLFRMARRDFAANARAFSASLAELRRDQEGF